MRFIILQVVCFILATTICLASDFGSVSDAAIKEEYVNNWLAYAKVIEVPGQFKDMRYFAVAQEIKTLLALELISKYKVEYDQNAFTEFAKNSEKSQNSSNHYVKLRDKLKTVPDDQFYRTFFSGHYADKLLNDGPFRASKDSFNMKREAKAVTLAKKLSKNPSDFSAAAKKAKYDSATLTASLNSGISASSKDGQKIEIAARLSKAAKDAETIAATLKKGEVSSTVISARDHFIVVKLSGKNDSGYLLEGILIPKASYEEWFAAEVAKIPVKIHDAKIRREVKERAVWAQNISIK